MSSNYTIDVERKLVFKTHLGVISESDTTHFLESIVSDPTFRKGMNFYCDYSRATVEWTMEEIERFRHFVNKLKYLTGQSRWAVIFATEADTRTAQTFVDLHEAFGDTIEVRIFTDRDRAMDWLKSTESETTKIEIEAAER